MTGNEAQPLGVEGAQMQAPDAHKETIERRALQKGCWWVVRASIVALLALIMLAVLSTVVWRAIGGPAYLECLVSTVDASECRLFE